MKHHWKLTLSYDGTDFHGWQVQPGLRTVQETLGTVIRQVVGESVVPHGSGRTDAGVHALEQVVSFSMEASIPCESFVRALNRALPSSVRVLSAVPAPVTFHARHSAVAKTYEYRIFRRRATADARGKFKEEICSPFIAPYVWDCRWPLLLESMQTAAASICGTQDFTSFAATDPDKSTRHEDKAEPTGPNPVKTIWHSSWTEESGLLIYRVRGSGFLHHMVRNLVGTFVDVGRGSLKPGDIPRILAARSRSAAGPTAPPQGLFLKSVEYPIDTMESSEPV